MKKMKKFLVLAVALIMVFTVISACGGNNESAETEAAKTEAAKTEAAKTEAVEAEVEETEAEVEPPADDETIEIGVLIKGTDSDFWQQVLVGAKNFGVDHQDVNITEYGPTSEADSAEQTEIMDTLVTTKPDGIAVAPTLLDNLSAGIENAMDQGIPVAIIDNKPSTDNYVTMYATDAYTAGGMVAETYLAELEARGIEPNGVVGLISPMAGQDTVIKRVSGFVDTLADKAPDIKVLEEIYVDNDIPTALAAAEDIYTANKDDLIGYFASNNATGTGLSQFMTELLAEDEEAANGIVAVAFDSDQAEIDAIRGGALFATAVQNPYEMGYQACQAVYDVITGAKTADDFDHFNDTGVSLITKANVDDPEMEGIIDPFTLKKY